MDKIVDFEISPSGINNQWANFCEHRLTLVEANSEYATSVKIAYSALGIYFLIKCEDSQLTATLNNDFDDLYTEDVVEIFLWPDESKPVYFEYELSPLNKELVLLVPNYNDTFMGWRPWHYEGDRKIKKYVHIQDKSITTQLHSSEWQAEIFIPFQLLKGLCKLPPQAGATWKSNVCRMDYDRGVQAKWALFPEVGGLFHSYKNFGVFRFD